MAERCTEAELANRFANILNGDEAPTVLKGWDITGLDLGEIEAVAPDGTTYRLTVEIVED